MDVDDLIERLCTMAGTIMEDASVGAISHNVNLNERIDALALASRTISALVDAAAAIAVRRR